MVGVSGPRRRQLPPGHCFEVVRRAGRGLARELAEIVHHVHLIVVAEAIGLYPPTVYEYVGVYEAPCFSAAWL
jgi:hypothetical protein